MVFNSIKFLLFFAVLFFLYYFICGKSHRTQNCLLLVASYVFYGFADWEMLPLLFGSTAIYYFLGLKIKSAEKDSTRAHLTTLAIVLGVGILLYFKYLNFFIDSFAGALNAIGLNCNIHSLKIIMPVGISFFTFKLISYTIEVNWETIEPTRDFISFATYISFFPCILSGPIDRPEFIEQIEKDRPFDGSIASDGVRQFIWGLFKKSVIADNCAIYVDKVWADIPGSSSSTMLLASILYAFQLYADFSGYSDMAIGVGKVLGFRIIKNFRYPFHAINIADFWRRWHISLTSWVTDYVFTPLSIAFRRMGKSGIILAILINLFIVGMWHEANWTCAVYGLFHGLLFIPLIISGSFNKRSSVTVGKCGLPCLGDFGRIILTFCLVTFSFMIFRAENLVQFGQYVTNLCSSDIISVPFFFVGTKKTLAFISVLIILEWLARDKEHPFSFGAGTPLVLRLIACYAAIICILEFGAHSQSFIYFQF